ncbi:MAG TPA: leucine-rich repeat protein, partial [Candidatus Fimenecus excrementigallinarum]|nr:leucine-rich repeat protein [Candidatus Fimenecus excrementigallinarum]
LTQVKIPNGVTQIPHQVFEGCTSLTSVFIPESVMYIEESAFLDCENVTIYGAAGSYAETYAERNDIRFVGVSPTLAKDRSQVRFTAENGDIADAFDYRLISSIPDTAWDLYFDNGSGGTTITAVGFVAANESDRATLADAQAAVENGTALPAGWKTADTDYIQKTDDDADAYFGCIIKGIRHSEQTEDIVCSAYIAYTTAAGQTAYVWYDAPIVAPVATNYDAAANAWREMNA